MRANNTADTSLSEMPLLVFMRSFLPFQGEEDASSSPSSKCPGGLVLLRWRRWPLPWRQRSNVDGHRVAIFLAEQRGVVDDLSHVAARIIAGWVHAVVEEAGDVLHRPGDLVLSPMTEPHGRNVRHPAFAVGRRATGEPLALDDAPEEIARAVALGAVSGAVDQIGAAIPLRRLRLVGDER